MTKQILQQLKTLIELPKDEYITKAKELNPDLTEKDLADMFPAGWEAKHIEMNYRYADFAKHQMIIDAKLEEQFCGSC